MDFKKRHAYLVTENLGNFQPAVSSCVTCGRALCKKCRLAIPDCCKRNQLATGNKGWQLYTLQKNVKPNNVSYPRLNNGYDKFTEFVFILKNNATQERRFVIYSFDEETGKPVFLYDESAPEDGQIKNEQ